MTFFGGQDDTDTIWRNCDEAVLYAHQLVLGLASHVYAAETRIQVLQASLMAVQKMT